MANKAARVRRKMSVETNVLRLMGSFRSDWRLLGIGGLMAVSVLALGAATPAHALVQDDEEEESEERSFSSDIGEIVLKAQENLQNENPQEAINQLNRAMDREPSNYERSVILQMRGQAYYETEQAQRAINDWQAAINTGMLEADAASSLQVNIGQLLIVEGRVQEGAQILERWLQNNPPKENILILLASAYAQNDQFRQALPHAEQAFEIADPKERKHFDLLNFIYTQLDMPEKQADILRQMLNRWPDDKNLWNGWVSMLANGNRNEEAFEVNKIMYLNGMLDTESDIIRLVQYYSYYEVPYRGAQILEREMNAGRVERNQKNLELMINLWRQAREYDEAIPALETAASNSGNGKLYEQLCEAYYSEAEYAKAERACLNGLDKGGLSRPGDSWVLIGNSRYERDDIAGAKQAFERGTQFSHSASTARGWLGFIREEERAVEARAEFQKTVEREECIITIERIRRDDVLEGREGVSSIPERCEEYTKYVDMGG